MYKGTPEEKVIEKLVEAHNEYVSLCEKHGEPLNNEVGDWTFHIHALQSLMASRLVFGKVYEKEVFGVLLPKLENVTTDLKIGQVLTFDEFVEYGKKVAINLVEGMPWSFYINGQIVTHVNDNQYLIQTGPNRQDSFKREDRLEITRDGVKIYQYIAIHSKINL